MKFGDDYVRKAHITTVKVEYRSSETLKKYFVVLLLINGVTLELGYPSKEVAMLIFKAVLDNSKS